MKLTIQFLVLGLLFGTMGIAIAQDTEEEESNIFVIVTSHTQFPDDGSIAERDSLLKEVYKHVVMKNDKVISRRVLSHLYSSDSNEWVTISEYKNWADVEAARKLGRKLFRAHWSDQKQRDAFNDALGKYFENWHGDAIYTEVDFLRK